MATSIVVFFYIPPKCKKNDLGVNKKYFSISEICNSRPSGALSSADGSQRPVVSGKQLCFK